MSDISDIKLTYWTWPSLGIALIERPFTDGWKRVEIDSDD